MRMMIGIFGDMNSPKLLCYLDDLLVFPPSEDEAISRLHIVFQRLPENNLKLAPKKCHFLQKPFLSWACVLGVCLWIPPRWRSSPT